MTRLLSLDVGDSRIGIALSDPLGVTARGLFVLERTNIKADIRKIMETIQENECSSVVVGLPLNLSGSDSVQTTKIRAFAERLENTLRSNAMQNVSVILYDERFSTKIAESAMLEAGARKSSVRENIDMRAAEVILADYLESLRR